MSILNSGYVGAPGGYGIKALAFSNGALHFDTPEYGTDNPDTFIHVRDSGTSVFGAGTSTSLSTSNGAAGNLLLACVATDGDMGAIVSDDWLPDGFTLAYADSTLRCYYKRLTTTYVGTNHTVTWTNSVSRNSCYVECKNMVGDTPTFVSSPPKHEMSYASLDTNFDHYIEAGESHDDGDGRLWILFMGNNGYSGTGGTPSTGVPEMIPSFESNPSTGADISWKTLAAGPRSSSQSAYIRAVAVQGSYRPYAMGWHTGAFASGAGNNEGILMVWRYAYTGPSAAWAHGEAPAWT